MTCARSVQVIVAVLADSAVVSIRNVSVQFLTDVYKRQEQKNTGAYYCLYPSFLDSCQLLARVAERSGRSIFLMLLNPVSYTHLRAPIMRSLIWMESTAG